MSGSGNVAQHTAEKLIQLGAKVVTLSDSNGYIYDRGRHRRAKSCAYVKRAQERPARPDRRVRRQVPGCPSIRRRTRPRTTTPCGATGLTAPFPAPPRTRSARRTPTR
ncbi:MAG: hypothetical protein MZV70_73490 [Desulfobacterales bacterium]|nr:hypothetical protein [Desulfobacterales bacterium]